MEQNDYELIPVYYCKRCLSLRILSITDDDSTNYCDKCGSTDIGQCLNEEWEKMVDERKRKINIKHKLYGTED